MKKHYSILSIIITIFFCMDAHAISIKVMSYNILNTYFTDIGEQSVSWNQRKSLVYQIISSTDADIIGFKEDSATQVADLEIYYPNYGVIKSPLETIVPDKGHRAIFFNTSKFI